MIRGRLLRMSIRTFSSLNHRSPVIGEDGRSGRWKRGLKVKIKEVSRSFSSHYKSLLSVDVLSRFFRSNPSKVNFFFSNPIILRTELRGPLEGGIRNLYTSGSNMETGGKEEGET